MIFGLGFQRRYKNENIQLKGNTPSLKLFGLFIFIWYTSGELKALMVLWGRWKDRSCSSYMF